MVAVLGCRKAYAVASSRRLFGCFNAALLLICAATLAFFSTAIQNCFKSCTSLAQAAMDRLAKFAVANFDYVEDHIRPVVRRYIPGPVQKKSE